MRGLPYDVKALVEKARDTALLAVETYNRPTATFRSGAYVVLMIIAWTSLFHAMFLRKDAFRSSLSADVQNDLAYSFKVFLVPKIGNHASKDSVAVEWIKYDPSKSEEMRQYEKVVAMIKPKEVQIANLGLLKPTQVATQVAARLGKRFTIYDHKLCYEHFKIRPPGGALDPSACNPQFCVYDDLHKDYCYKAEWVDFLAQKLGDPALYENIIAKRKATARPIEGRSATT